MYYVCIIYFNVFVLCFTIKLFLIVFIFHGIYYNLLDNISYLLRPFKSRLFDLIYLKSIHEQVAVIIEAFAPNVTTDVGCEWAFR